MPITRLTDRTVLALRGPETRDFLQGLVTNDINRLEAQPAIYAGLLTPQGKVMTDFFIVADGEADILIDVATSQGLSLLAKLKLYRLRRRIEITDLTATHGVAAIWGDAHVAAAPPGTRIYSDSRAPGLGTRMIVDLEDCPADTPAQAVAYAAHRLAAGVPDTADVEGQFALDANFEELGGVDFRKGCFVGQEVTARMKHKAQPRKRLVSLSLTGTLPAFGAKLTDAAGTEIGELKSGAGTQAIASLRLDRYDPAAALSVNGVAAALVAPSYDMPALVRPTEPA